jgi:hypothetical protein
MFRLIRAFAADLRAAWVLAAYTLVALVLTWPLAAHFTTHMPGNGIDDPSLGWNLWWIKERLIDQVDLDIFHVGWMFHPIAINLAFYTLTPLNGLLSIPLQTVFGLTAANNLILLSSFVLSGYGVFLLVHQELPAAAKGNNSPFTIHHSQLIPFLAGLLYAFASAKLFYAALGQYNIASSQWIPFCVLYVLRIGRGVAWRQTLRNTVLAALFLIFQAWAELTFASFLILFIAIYAVWLAITRLHSQFTIHGSTERSTERSRRSLAEVNSQFTILPFVLIALIFLIGLAPFLWAMLPDLGAEGDFFTSGGGFADVFSADLAGYLVPTRLHPLFGDWVATLPFPNDVGQHIYIGYAVLVFAGLGVLAMMRHTPLAIHNSQFTIHHSRWFWPLITLFFWWMTLGPRIRWLGHETPIPGPFALISLLPFFNGNRYPSRYSVMLLLGVAVLAGWGFDFLLRRADRHPEHRFRLRITHYAWPILFAGLFLFEHLSVPLPLNDFRVPEIYSRLAAMPGDFAVLELPTGWRNGARVLGKSDKLIMMQQWYQTVHGKRRLGGNTSRNPPYKFQYFTDAPLLGDLIALMNADRDYMQPVIDAEFDAIVARNRPIAAQVLADLEVEMVVVHVEKSPPALLRFVDEVLPLALVEEWQGSDWDGQPSIIRLYRVNKAPITPVWEENLATRNGNLYLAEGWSSVTPADERIRYATRNAATLMLNLPETGGQLELELFGPATAAEVRLNGRILTATTLSPDPAEKWLSIEIPPGMAEALIDRLEVRFGGLVTPVVELPASSDSSARGIGETGRRFPAGLSLVVQSAGNDVGDFAHIWVNGVDESPNQIGYNLVAMDAAGAVLDSATFNSFAAPDQSMALAAWIEQWPAGTIIAGAVRDEASYQLQPEAVAALNKIGVAGDLRGKFRWSHAFIGAVGASPGSAMEMMQLLQPATIYMGVPVDGPTVSGGVGRVRFR